MYILRNICNCKNAFPSLSENGSFTSPTKSSIQCIASSNTPARTTMLYKSTLPPLSTPTTFSISSLSADSLVWHSSMANSSIPVLPCPSISICSTKNSCFKTLNKSMWNSTILLNSSSMLARFPLQRYSTCQLILKID